MHQGIQITNKEMLIKTGISLINPSLCNKQKVDGQRKNGSDRLSNKISSTLISNSRFESNTSKKWNIGGSILKARPYPLKSSHLIKHEGVPKMIGNIQKLQNKAVPKDKFRHALISDSRDGEVKHKSSATFIDTSLKFRTDLENEKINKGIKNSKGIYNFGRCKRDNKISTNWYRVNSSNASNLKTIKLSK